MGKQERNRKNKRRQSVPKPEIEVGKPHLLKAMAAAMLLAISTLILLTVIGIWHQARRQNDAGQYYQANAGVTAAAEANKAGHQPKAEMVEFYDRHVKGFLNDQLSANSYPIPEINAYFSELLAKINQRFGVGLIGNLQDKYGTGDALFGYSVENNQPELWVIIPSIRDFYQELQKRDPKSADATLETTLVIYYLQIMQYLADHPGQKLTAEERIAYETKLWDASLRRMVEPMLANGRPLSGEQQKIYQQWLACGKNPDDPAWYECCKKIVDDCLLTWSQQETAKAYADAELRSYWDSTLLPVVKAVESGKFAIPEINDWFAKLNGELIGRYGRGVAFTGTLHYMPESQNVPMASTLFEDTPVITLLIPSYLDYLKEAGGKGVDRMAERTKNSLAAGIIHEMWHLIRDWPQAKPPTFDDLIESEKAVWGLTMEHIICPLIEKYRLPLERSDEIYYEHWIAAGRDADSPAWDSFIRNLYRQEGR